MGEGTLVAELPTVRVGPKSDVALTAIRSLPLALFGRPCRVRRAATGTLDASGMSWRVAVKSHGLAGLWAAVAAGLGLALRPPHGLPETLRSLDPAVSGLLPLPFLALRLRRGGSGGDPAVECLGALPHGTLAETGRA